MSSPTKEFKVSASSLKRAKCLRRWAAEKLCDYNDPGGKAAQFGNAVHKVGERWMKREAELDLSKPADRLFLEMIPHVPSRDMHAERPISLKIEGIPFHGFIDVSGRAGETFYTGDYKTSGKPKEYGLTTPEQMLADGQVIIYSFANMIDFGEPVTTARWMYANTTTNKYAFTSEVVVTLSQAEDLIDELILPPARKLVQTRSDFLALDTSDARVRLRVLNELPNDPEECNWGAWNCGFRKECELFSGPTITQGTDMATEDLKTKLARIRAEAAAGKAADVQDEDPKVVESATPAETAPLPPEAKEALEQAVDQRHLAPEDQDLGRKAAEANEKARLKAESEEKKAAKKSAKAASTVLTAEPGTTLEDMLELVKAIEATGQVGQVEGQIGSCKVVLRV